MKQKNFLFPRWFLVFSGFVIAFIIVSVYFFDVKIAYFFKDSPPGLVRVCNWVNNALYPQTDMIVFSVAYLLVRFVFKQREWSRRILLIALSVIVCHILVILFKSLFGRDRPELLFTNQIYGFHFFQSYGPELSFPSGHAVASAAIMGSLACFYPRYTALFLAAAFTLGFARVVVTAHYLSDILASLILGFFIPRLFFVWIFKR